MLAIFLAGQDHRRRMLLRAVLTTGPPELTNARLPTGARAVTPTRAGDAYGFGTPVSDRHAGPRPAERVGPHSPDDPPAVNASGPGDATAWNARSPTGTRWPQASARPNPNHPDDATEILALRSAPLGSGGRHAIRSKDLEVADTACSSPGRAAAGPGQGRRHAQKAIPVAPSTAPSTRGAIFHTLTPRASSRESPSGSPTACPKASSRAGGRKSC